MTFTGIYTGETTRNAQGQEIQTPEITRQSLIPTLFIGLGGTGHEVLSRIYDKLTLEIGDLSNYANTVFKFVCIDTDAASLPKNSHISSVGTPIGNIQAFLAHGEITGIQDWFPYNMKHANNVISAGAAAIRPYGRLAFFNNYALISQTISNEFITLNGAGADIDLRRSPLLSSRRITRPRVEPYEKNIVVIASTAGGTGSGMLIDTLGYLQYITSGMPSQPEINVYLLGPDNFQSLTNMSSAHANSYACLKELEYFQGNVNNTLNVNWGGFCRYTIRPTIANHIFFLAGFNENGALRTNIKDIYDMLAESLARDYSFGDFGTRKRSAIDNNKAAITTPFNYQIPVVQPHANGNITFTATKRYTRHFQSLGYASLGIDTNTLREAATHLLAQKTIEYWYSKPAESTLVAVKSDLLNRLKISGRLFATKTESKLIDGKPTDVMYYTDIISPLYLTLLGEYHIILQRAKQFEMPEKKNETVNDTPSYKIIQNDINNIELKFDNSSGKHDDIKSAIDALRDVLASAFNTELETWCQEQTNSGYLNSIVPCLNLLKSVVENLQKEISEFGKTFEHAIDVRTKRLKDKIVVLKDTKDGIIPFLGCKDEDRSELAEDIYREALGLYITPVNIYKGLIIAKLHKHIADTLANVFSDFLGTINAFTQLYSLDVIHLKDIQVHFDKMITPLYTNNANKTQIRSIFDCNSDNLNKVLNTCFSNRENVYRSITINYLNDFSTTDLKYSFSKLKDALSKFTLAKTDYPWIETLESFCRYQLDAPIKQNFNFWQTFYNLHSLECNDWQTYIHQLCNSSKVWLTEHAGIGDGGDALLHKENDIVIALPRLNNPTDDLINFRDHQVVKYIKSELNKAGIGFALIANHTDVGEISPFESENLVIAKTTAPLPICVDTHVNAFVADYKTELNIKPLHITRNDYIFSDIYLENKANVEEKIERMKTVILMLMFNLITLDTNTAEYKFKDMYSAHPPHILANYNNNRSAIHQAYDYLGKNSDFYESIKNNYTYRKLDQMLKSLNIGSVDSPTTAWERYCLIAKTAANAVNNTEEDKWVECAYESLLHEAFARILGTAYATVNNRTNNPNWKDRLFIVNQALSENPNEFLIDTRDGFMMWEQRADAII